MSFRFFPDATKGLRHAGFALALAFAVGLAPLAEADTATPAPPLAAALPSFAPLVKKVMPAVVNISAALKPGADEGDDQGDEQDQADPDNGPQQGFPPSPFDQLLRRFFEQQGRPMPRERTEHTTALGSGFIIDPAGYVVTNNHVVQNADKVTVIFQDGTQHPAKIIGRDPKTDLALLKINAPKPLPFVSWGDSNAEQVGDWIVAVGNPFGLGGSVSPGVISARGRDIHAGPYDDFLQLDASINRGNSGGPTFNLAGQVIGINTAIYSPNGGSVGIGFAIPSSLAKPVIEQLRQHGKVSRGWLGVQIQQVTPEIAKSLGLSKGEGALVADVTTGGPAAKAGFKQGDVILAFDGHKIDKVRDLPIVVAESAIGHKADVKIWRSGKEATLHPDIAAMPDNPQIAQAHRAPRRSTEQNSALGLRLAPLTNEWRQRLNLAKSVKGVVVTRVDGSSPFNDLGLQVGDVIESIDQHPTVTPREVVERLERAKKEKSGANLLILLNRNGVNQYVALSLAKPENKG
jgi:serine protease Do